MRRMRAFTLVELLVVIAIIALLLAVLVPSLNKARDLAKRIVCGSHVHSIGVANATYESTYGMYLPIAFDTHMAPQYPAGDTDLLEGIWFSNKGFRRIMSVDSYREEEGIDLLQVPDEFRCPADNLSKDTSNATDGVLVSFAYNLTEWVDVAWAGGSWADDYSAGYGPGMIKTPAEKLAFIDAPDWWCQWQYANYETVWDEWGERKIDFYQAQNVWGPVFYRHSDGADVGFYDGHVEYMKKNEVFVEDDWYASPKKSGMWAINYR